MSTITKDFDQVLAHLKTGGVAAIPTETVYGLAASAENETAIRAIYSIKNRPVNHPLIMHVAADWDLAKWVSFIPDYAKTLIAHFWPGPLTLVMKSNPSAVSPLITGGQDTIALRAPHHPLAQALLEELNFPLVAPSANPFGKISPTTAEHVLHSFPKEDILILDGGRCTVGIESTIVTALDPKGYSILRHGLIDEVQLEELLPKQALPQSSSIRVPGKLKNHYQPQKPLFCFNNLTAIKAFCQQSQSPVFVLTFHEDALSDYCFPNSPEKAAFELYYQLRKADQSEASCLAIELPSEEIAWAGVRERILKAGATT